MAMTAVPHPPIAEVRAGEHDAARNANQRLLLCRQRPDQCQNEQCKPAHSDRHYDPLVLPDCADQQPCADRPSDAHDPKMQVDAKVGRPAQLRHPCQNNRQKKAMHQTQQCPKNGETFCYVDGPFDSSRHVYLLGMHCVSQLVIIEMSL